MSKSTRQAFGESLAQLGESHSEIVVLDADLSKSTRSELFKKKFPDRFIQMGISEANMIGTAAGLSFTGKLPFLCSFGCFLTGRFDTIRLSVAYSRANVRLVGTHSGLGIGDDGYSQMGLEDISLMRSLPEMGVFQPMDEFETVELMHYLVREWKGPAYLRLTRQAVPNLFPQGKKFSPGKFLEILSSASTSVQGQSRGEVVCLASGATVAEAVSAARDLNARRIPVSVWNVHCIKPLDQTTLETLSKKAEMFITVEDHTVIGGLGGAVAEGLSAMSNSPKLLRLGVQDRFGESGDGPELYDQFGFSAKKIAEQIASHYPHL